MTRSPDLETDLGPRIYGVLAATVTVVFAAVAVVWALVMPAFSGPDELRHYNSVVRVLDGGGWPEPYKADVLDATFTAFYESGAEYRGVGLAHLPDPEDRSTVLDGGPSGFTVSDQMVQHPPAYYYLLASVVSASDEASLRWDHAQLSMRLLSAMLVAGAVPLLIGIGRWITGSRLAGIAAGSAILFVPFFGTAAGHISNDALLILACTTSLYAAVRAVVSLRPAWLLVCGAALGVALLTKGFALLLIPVIAAFAVLAVVRAGLRPWRAIAIAGATFAIAFAIGGWWWLRNLITIGKLQPSMLGNRERSTAPHPDYDLLEFMTSAVGRLNRTFWGRGARAEFALPELAVMIAGGVSLAIVVAALFFARRRLEFLLLMSFPVLILTTTLVNAHAIYWDIGDPSRGVQGRYVFASITAWTTAVAIVVWTATRRGSLRARSTVVAAVFLMGALTTVAAGWWVIRSISEPDGIWAYVAATGVRHGVPPATLLVAVAVGIVAAAATVAILCVGTSVGSVRHAAPWLDKEDA